MQVDQRHVSVLERYAWLWCCFKKRNERERDGIKVKKCHGWHDRLPLFSPMPCLDGTQLDQLDNVGQIACGASEGLVTRLFLMFLEKS